MPLRDFSSTSVHAASRKTRKWLPWFAILSLLGIVSLGCELSQQVGTPPAGQQGNNRPQAPTLQGNGFLATDCSVSGITFPDITVSYNVDDPYNGPYLVCNSSSEGAHGLSVHYYINIVAYQAAKLDAIYQEQQANIQGFVDQSNEWNADPDIPAEIKDEITFLRNDSDGIHDHRFRQCSKLHQWPRLRGREGAGELPRPGAIPIL
jgi:hypothetical protein